MVRTPYQNAHKIGGARGRRRAETPEIAAVGSPSPSPDLPSGSVQTAVSRETESETFIDVCTFFLFRFYIINHHHREPKFPDPVSRRRRVCFLVFFLGNST